MLTSKANGEEEGEQSKKEARSKEKGRKEKEKRKKRKQGKKEESITEERGRIVSSSHTHGNIQIINHKLRIITGTTSLHAYKNRGRRNGRSLFR